MNSNPNNPGLPRVSSADSPFAPRSPTSYMSSKILITALIALVIIIFFITAYRVYVHVFWGRPRPIVASWRHNRGETPTSGGLDKAIIDSLPTFTYTTRLSCNIANELGPTECAVCLIEFQDDDACRLLPKCNHSFHTECIDKWFLSNTTCPMCRTHTEMVDAISLCHAKSTRACLLPNEDVHGHIKGSDLSPFHQEGNNRMQSPRSHSTASISLHEDIINNDRQKTRSVSLFGGEQDERLGLHMRQILACRFSSRANGTYDMVGEEMHVNMHSINTMAGSMHNNGGIAEGDVERDRSLIRSHASEVLVQHIHLPNWQRSASDKCLNVRQDVQYPTNVLFHGNDSQPTPCWHKDYWQVGGRSLPHISIEVPRLHDGFFHAPAASLSIGEQPPLPHYQLAE